MAQKAQHEISAWFLTNYLIALGSNGYTLNYGKVYFGHDGVLSESENIKLHSYLFFTMCGTQATIALEIGNAVRTQWKIDEYIQWFNELTQQPQVQPELSIF